MEDLEQAMEAFVGFLPRRSEANDLIICQKGGGGGLAITNGWG